MVLTAVINHGPDSSDSDPGGESWRRGMNNAEQMHVLASAGINPSDSDIEIDKGDLQRYKKQAKKYFKKKAMRIAWTPV